MNGIQKLVVVLTLRLVLIEEALSTIRDPRRTSRRMWRRSEFFIPDEDHTILAREKSWSTD